MYQPSYRLISPQANRSFIFKWERFDLTTRWHYHPEIELIYFIKGRTTGVIGNGFHNFNEGDLVLLGKNFPHVLQENREFSKKQPLCKPFGLIIQFTEDFLGFDFLNKPEITPIKKILEKANRGLRFRSKSVNKVAAHLLNMHQQTESRKLISLLDILLILSERDSYRYLTSTNYFYDHTQDEERMHKINQYLYENFMDTITVKKAASIANFTPTSFCRYFKARTLKSFTQYLNEIRIAYACRQLNNADFSVSHVCSESGFNSLSYFNRQFKKIMKMSPKKYQQLKTNVV